jgi:hypothetical protein
MIPSLHHYFVLISHCERMANHQRKYTERLGSRNPLIGRGFADYTAFTNPICPSNLLFFLYAYRSNISDMNETIVEMVDPTSVISIAQPRISTWTCRLPSELMARICEILVKDVKQHTLSNLQEVSSAIYTLATRYLYQHLHLDHPPPSISSIIPDVSCQR